MPQLASKPPIPEKPTPNQIKLAVLTELKNALKSPENIDEAVLTGGQLKIGENTRINNNFGNNAMEAKKAAKQPTASTLKPFVEKGVFDSLLFGVAKEAIPSLLTQTRKPADIKEELEQGLLKGVEIIEVIEDDNKKGGKKIGSITFKKDSQLCKIKDSGTIELSLDEQLFVVDYGRLLGAQDRFKDFNKGNLKDAGQIIKFSSIAAAIKTNLYIDVFAKYREYAIEKSQDDADSENSDNLALDLTNTIRDCQDSVFNELLEKMPENQLIFEDGVASKDFNELLSKEIEYAQGQVGLSTAALPILITTLLVTGLAALLTAATGIFLLELLLPLALLIAVPATLVAVTSTNWSPQTKKALLITGTTVLAVAIVATVALALLVGFGMLAVPALHVFAGLGLLTKIALPIVAAVALGYMGWKAKQGVEALSSKDAPKPIMQVAGTYNRGELGRKDNKGIGDEIAPPERVEEEQLRQVDNIASQPTSTTDAVKPPKEEDGLHKSHGFH